MLTAGSVYDRSSGVPADPVKTAAYFRLFVDRADADDEQRRWLDSFNAKLSEDQRAEAARLVTSYSPRPTPLTLKALSGLCAAKALVEAKR